MDHRYLYIPDLRSCYIKFYYNVLYSTVKHSKLETGDLHENVGQQIHQIPVYILWQVVDGGF